MTTANQTISMPAPLTSSEENTWAMLSHLTVLINLFTGILGPVAALGIYLLFGHRSKYVAYHAMQSFLFQGVVWYGIGIMWAIVGILSSIVVGVVLIPFACLFTPILLLGMAIAPIYGIYAAIKTSQGEDFRYWIVGDWVRGMLN